MANPTDIRRLALLMLYRLDARAAHATDQPGEEPGEDPAEIIAEVRETAEQMEPEDWPFTEPTPKFRPGECDRAAGLALRAHEHRDEADAEFDALAPDWPTSRRPAVDRAVLRLAHRELSEASIPPAVAINEAVELARAFSTEGSPAFINGLLAKVTQRLAGRAAAGEAATGGTMTGRDAPRE